MSPRCGPSAEGFASRSWTPLLLLSCGDVIEIPMRLRVPDTYRDPGAWSYSDYLLGQGISALATARTQRLRVVGHVARTWSCELASAQSWAAKRLQSLSAGAAWARTPAWMRLDRGDTAMLSAMLVGDRTQLTTSLRQGFERTGTFHLFVVSGLHVVLIVGGLLWLLRRLRTPEGLAIAMTLCAGLGLRAVDRLRAACSACARNDGSVSARTLAGARHRTSERAWHRSGGDPCARSACVVRGQLPDDDAGHYRGGGSCPAD